MRLGRGRRRPRARKNPRRRRSRPGTVTATAQLADLYIITYLDAHLDECGRNASKPLAGPPLERFLPWNTNPAHDYGLTEDLQLALNHMIARLLNGGALTSAAARARSWAAAAEPRQPAELRTPPGAGEARWGCWR